MKVSQICDPAGYMRKVSIDQYFRTIHHVNDVFGGKAGSCREYTLSRDDQDSEPTGWILKTEHLTGRSTRAYVSDCVPCCTFVTVVSQLTFHPMHLHWLQAWWIESAFYFSTWTGNRIGDPLQRSQRRSLVWPSGRTVPAHRLCAQLSDQDFQRTNADNLSVTKKQFSAQTSTTCPSDDTDTLDAGVTSPLFTQENEMNPFSDSVHRQAAVRGSSNPQQPASSNVMHDGRSCGKLQQGAHDHVMHKRGCGKLQRCAHVVRSCGKLQQGAHDLSCMKGVAGNCNVVLMS